MWKLWAFEYLQMDCNGSGHIVGLVTSLSLIKYAQGSNLSSRTRKMRVKKAISKVAFSLLAFSCEWKFGARYPLFLT